MIILFFVFKSQSLKSLLSKKNQGQIAFEKDTEVIHSMIQECMNAMGVDGARLSGLQGGPIILNENYRYIELNSSKVAYGNYRGSESLLSLSDIEGQIAEYIDLTFQFCIESFEINNVNIEFQGIDSKVNIKPKQINFNSKIKISLEKEDNSIYINKNYEEEVPIDIYGVYETAKEIIDKENENPGSLDLTYLASSEYQISVVPYRDDTMIYIINDENEENSEYYYSFRFGSNVR